MPVSVFILTSNFTIGLYSIYYDFLNIDKILLHWQAQAGACSM